MFKSIVLAIIALFSRLIRGGQSTKPKTLRIPQPNPEAATLTLLGISNDPEGGPAAIIDTLDPRGRVRSMLTFTVFGIGRDDIDTKTRGFLDRAVKVERIDYDNSKHQGAGIPAFTVHAHEMKKWEEGIKPGTGMLPLMPQEMADKNAFFARLYATAPEIILRVRQNVSMITGNPSARRAGTGFIMNQVGKSDRKPPTRAFMARTQTVDAIELSQIEATVAARTEQATPQPSASLLEDMRQTSGVVTTVASPTSRQHR